MDNRRYTTLTEAAQIATTRCDAWRFAYSVERFDRASLLSIAEIHDEENPADEDSFYLVSPGGAIGFTEDCGESIDWLFLCPDGAKENLPASLPAEVQINFCPKCGKPVTPGARFCASCGAAGYCR